MNTDLLILLCRWSPLFVWLLAKYYERKGLIASSYQREGESASKMGEERGDYPNL
jgi:hypothetical protein